MSRGDSRVTYRRRNSYNTRSNKIKKVTTPGGTLTVQYRTKASKGARCGDCHTQLSGIPRVRPTTLKTLAKHHRTVSRPYGGSRCASCTKTRILRAFIVEEHKIVRKLLSDKAKAGNKA